jgi:hypothetical protein
MVTTRSQASNDPTYTHEEIENDSDSNDSFVSDEDESFDGFTLHDDISQDVFYQNTDFSVEERQLARIVRHEINTGIKNFFDIFQSLRESNIIEEDEEEYESEDDSVDEHSSELPSVRVNTFEIPSDFIQSTDDVKCLQAEDFQTLTLTELKHLCSRFSNYTQYNGSYELTDITQILQLLTKIPRNVVVHDCPICLHAAWKSHELVCCHQVLCDTCHTNVQGVCPYCRRNASL